MPRIAANGIELYYELKGPSDAPVLVLSNGILMSTSSWAFQAPLLSRKYRLLLYDCRGQWQSDHPSGPYTIEQHADDLAALLDALAIQQAHIGGVSYGGELSLAFALKYPQRTKSLIVGSVVSQVDPVLAGVVGAWRDAACQRDPDLLYQVTYPFNFSDRWIAANGPALANARARYAALDFDAVVRLIDAFLALDVTDQLDRITAPAMVMVGEEDILKPRRYAQLIASRLPQAEFVIVPASGHALMWEQPETFNSLVLGFVEQAELRS
jgi:3-oxoadipate enol-lactonase